jgi:hypothetical protein
MLICVCLRGIQLYNINAAKSSIANKILVPLASNSKKINLTTKIKSDIDSKGSNSSAASSEPISFIINPNDIEILPETSPLGSGQFGLVRRAVWTTHKGTKVNVAVKTINPANESSRDGRPEGSLQAFSDMLNEISCMCGLHHRNLITLYGIVSISMLNDLIDRFFNLSKVFYFFVSLWTNHINLTD